MTLWMRLQKDESSCSLTLREAIPAASSSSCCFSAAACCFSIAERRSEMRILFRSVHVGGAIQWAASRQPSAVCAVSGGGRGQGGFGLRVSRYAA